MPETLQPLPVLATDEPEFPARLLQPWRVPFGADMVHIGGQSFRAHESGGGLVSLRAVVAPSVYVGPNAMIKGGAIVVGSVRLFDRSVIEDTAIVADMCTLRDDACIGGEAIVRGQVTLAHHSRIDGDARVNGGVLLQHFAHISRGVLSGGMTVN
jgi:UDP-3-O-[3-hydroxymyristoyl] glucosamine N-acyltransferase